MKFVLVAILCCGLVACGGSEPEYHQETLQCDTADKNIICKCDATTCTFEKQSRDRKIL